jgi:hypothetical protein
MSLSIVVHAECGAFRQEEQGGNRPVLPDGNAAGNAQAPDSVCGVTVVSKDYAVHGDHSPRPLGSEQGMIVDDGDSLRRCWRREELLLFWRHGW